MPSLPILDVVIGVVFVYLLLALLCSTLNEIFAGLTKRRAKFLDEALARVFGSEEKKNEFFATPFVTALAPRDPERSRRQKLADTVLRRPKDPRPSYIPSDVFALAVRDMLTGNRSTAADIAAVRESAATVGSPEFHRALVVMLDESIDIAAFDAKLRKYFDETMDRVSGWYKRNAQAWSLALAVFVTLVVNADTIRMIQTLWTNPTVRAMAIEAAAVRRDMDPPPDLIPMVIYTDGDEPEKGTPVEFKFTPKEQELMASLTGWDPDWADFSRRLAKRQAAKAPSRKEGAAEAQAPSAPSIGDRTAVFVAWVGGLLWRHAIGWLLTILAVTMGAPFWFDTLKKFMNVRYAGPAPNEPKK